MPTSVAETPVLPEAPVLLETPEITPEPAPLPEEPEKIYEYQPTDELGRNLGGKQVLKYRTQDELAQKLTEQNVLLVRKLREQTKKRRLGTIDPEDIPDTAPKFDTPLDFTPRQLTSEDRIQLSRDLLDPERFDQANSTMCEATFGQKPEAIRQTLATLQTTSLRLLAKSEADAFVSGTPGYYKCQENFETITNWMLKNNLSPVRDNFKRAYDAMLKAELLIEAPAVIVPTVEIAPVLPAPVPATLEPAPEPSRPVVPRMASGLTREQAADISGAVKSTADDIVYDQPVKDRFGKPTGHVVRYTGLAAIDKMPSDEFKRRVHTDSKFNQKYERLLNEDEQRRAQRG
jgi:hypothetical protein